MKKTICLLIIFYVTGSGYYFAQFKEDYIVKLKGDTVSIKIEKLKAGNRSIVTRVNGKKQITKADSLAAICYNMYEYESISINGTSWNFMMKETDGDIIVYREEYSHTAGGGPGSPPTEVTTLNYYFRLRNEPRDKIYTLSVPYLQSYTRNCRPIMDSLLKKNGNSFYLIDLVKFYNKRCSEIKKK